MVKSNQNEYSHKNSTPLKMLGLLWIFCKSREIFFDIFCNIFRSDWIISGKMMLLKESPRSLIRPMTYYGSPVNIEQILKCFDYSVQCSTTSNTKSLEIPKNTGWNVKPAKFHILHCWSSILFIPLLWQHQFEFQTTKLIIYNYKLIIEFWSPSEFIISYDANWLLNDHNSSWF